MKVDSMKSPLVVALIAALPIETANFWLAAFPIDTELPPDTDWSLKVIGYQWLCLHSPGLLLGSYLVGSRFEKFIMPFAFASGYLDTALLIALGVWAFRWWSNRSRKQPQLS